MGNVDAKQAKRQESVYNTLKKVLEQNDFGYEENAKELFLTVNVVGEDLEIPCVFMVSRELDVLVCYSVLPIKVKEEKAMDTMLILGFLTGHIPCGSFYYDVNQQSIVFRDELLFVDSIISEKTIDRFVTLAMNIVDKYNDRLFAFNSGIIDFKGFLSSVEE